MNPTTAPPAETEPGRSGRPSRFVRLASWSYAHRWAALALWVLLLAGLTFASQAAGSGYRNDHTLPGTGSQRAMEALDRHGAAQAAGDIQIVLRAGAGLAEPATRPRVEDMLARVRRLPRVTAVRSPYAGPGALSRDGTIGYATVTLDGRAESVPAADVRRIIDTAQAARTPGLRVELGGDPVREAQEGGGGGAEGAGMLGALVILVLTFGSLLAAALPILTAVFAVGSTLGLIVLASHLATVADYTPPILILVGLGVGIDYALLIFSRYRSELLAGADDEQAVRTALDSAGRTVFFAGCTVIIALLGLVVLGLGSLQGVALAVALTVLTTMAAALTLLPALLRVFGGRLRRAVRKRAARGVRRGRVDGAVWRRWATFVQRHPWPVLLPAVAVLLVLSAPALDLRLGFADSGTDTPVKTSRQAYDLLAEGFGPGFNGPLVVVAEGGDQAVLADALQRTLSSARGVAAVVPPIPTGDRQATVAIAFPTSAPQDQATTDLVTRLRTEVLPPLERTSGASIMVGGGTAAALDFSDKVASRMPVFVAIVVGLSALLLLVVFRSLLVPLKAAVLNLLSIGASMGIITYVFQEGTFGAQPGPVEAFVPVMIFAIVFGLSMDYEVFLLSRIHEEWESSRDAAHAVREGLATTGRVITAAAAIMIVVFAAFILSPDRMLQQFGLGLASAVLLDALVIRCLIVPAVMRLFGRSAWWLPSGLAGRLPRVSLERVVQERPGA